VSARYVVRPQADRDLNQQAYYLATEATVDIGHRFLIAAHETFLLLATHPDMGWSYRLNHPRLASLRMFRVSGFEKMLVLYRSLPDGVEIIRVVHGSRNLQALLRRQESGGD